MAELHYKRARANTVGDSHVDTTGSAPSVSAEEVSRLVEQLYEKSTRPDRQQSGANPPAYPGHDKRYH
ncbi:hypothetical protein N7467_009076 [Penicillium canescens]|nr:hypothetical protein N7467_009076 [Penicillium canescens]